MGHVGNKLNTSYKQAGASLEQAGASLEPTWSHPGTQLASKPEARWEPTGTSLDLTGTSLEPSWNQPRAACSQTARLYTVGIHRNFAPSCCFLSPSTTANVWRVALPDLLHKSLCSIDEGVLSPQQQQNLKVAKQCVALQPNVDGGCVSCISVDKDPHGQFAHFTRIDGCVGTLRTQSDLVLYQVNTGGTRF